MKILLTGGGTLGPVTPLLAIAEAVRERRDLEIVGFVGTTDGPERILVESAGLRFFSVTAGKMRRYFDIRNFFAPFLTLIGVVQSLGLLRKLRPTVVISGGAFVGVPVLLAARLLGIRTITHQQDVQPSLANRFMAGFVDCITVTFPQSASAFPAAKIVVTGNPVRLSLLHRDREQAIKRFSLDPIFPTLFVFGGGSGAQVVNTVLAAALPELTKFCQVIHGAGRGNGSVSSVERSDRYHPVELLTDEMADAYVAADLVVGRAGVGTITELAALEKPAIVVPIPGTHQEANAKLLVDCDAAVVMLQSELTAVKLTEAARALFEGGARRRALSEHIRAINPSDALGQMMKVIEDIVKK